MILSPGNTIKEARKSAINHMGIGLNNSLKLLEANYPERHEVRIAEEGRIYQLNLKMTL